MHRSVVSIRPTKGGEGAGLVALSSRQRGGLEAEREERKRWNEREQQKIMDSVNGKSEIIRLVKEKSPRTNIVYVLRGCSG